MSANQELKINPGHNYARGFSLGLTAYLIWGSFPIIVSALGFASPFEIVIWRVIFGFITAVGIISYTRGWQKVFSVFRNRRNLTWVATSSLMIFVNWLVYVLAVATHNVTEGSLGYAINPLITILLAMFFLNEKLSKYQWVALGLGTIAVIILTVVYGRLPWMALSLAVSFGIYGLAKNKLGPSVGAETSFAIESGLVFPLAIAMAALQLVTTSSMAFTENGVGGALALAGYGVLTAIPLILFGSAAKYLPLRYIGFMQYLTPLIQFTLALTYFHEPMPPARLLGVIFLGAGLVSLIAEAIKKTKPLN